MSETRYSTERKLSGTTRLFIGFVTGAVFALAPMYYFYMGREAAFNEGNPAPDQLFRSAAEPLRPGLERGTGGAEKPFASRMTYELSRLPEEPLPVVAKAPAAAATASVPPSRAAALVEPPPGTRIVDARPISTLPPDPRDRTAAIEREAQKGEYREAPRREIASSAQPRMFEGRPVELKTPALPDMPTRPIVAGSTGDTRGEIAAERGRSGAEVKRPTAIAEGARKERPDAAEPVAAGPRVPGVTPITRGSEQVPRPELLATANPALGAPAGATGEGPPARAGAGSKSVAGRLAFTREWLGSAAQTTHTIQLMGTNSEEQLESQLRSLSKLLEDDSIYVFRTIAQGKPSITVVYGAYSDRKSALQALEKLPPAVAANRPVLRTVNGIRTEMKKHKTDG